MAIILIALLLGYYLGMTRGKLLAKCPSQESHASSVAGTLASESVQFLGDGQRLDGSKEPPSLKALQDKLAICEAERHACSGKLRTANRGHPEHDAL